MRRLIAVALVVVHMLTTISAFAGKDNAALEYAKQWNKRTIWLRPTVTLSRKAYLHTSAGEFVYSYDRGRMFPVHSLLEVIVKKVKGGDDWIEFTVQHRALGKSQIKLEPVSESEIPIAAVDEFLRRVFAAGESDERVLDFVGDRRTLVTHAVVCNHVPTEDESVYFADRAAARQQGFRDCTICFMSRPRLNDYAMERRLGDQVASEVLRYSPLVHDDTLHAMVREAGTEVLAGWPITRKGYNYDFQVVESDIPNAIACPAGRVFVTRSLLNALESKEELKGVLAHEIAHVELRHGFRQYKRAKTAALLGTLAAVAAGVAAGKKSKSANTGVKVADAVAALGAIAAEIALAGYSRSAEQESDAFALAYLGSVPLRGGSHPFVRTLRKLEYYGDVMEIPVGDQGLLRSHRYIEDRVNRANNSEVAFLNPAPTFAGLNADGDVIATVRLDLEVLTDYEEIQYGKDPHPATYVERVKNTPRNRRINELQLYAEVEASPLLATEAQIREIVLTIGGRRMEFDNKEDTKIYPDDVAGCVFVSKKQEGFLQGPIEGIEIPLLNVTQWVQWDQ